jgi:nucleoside-diphosphate-sugar epimerase
VEWKEDPVKVLVTGSAGFINGYVVPELLEAGHTVVGIDNFSKYGPIQKSYENHPRYSLTVGDCKNVGLLKELASDCDQILAGAAMIGGISYFHTLAYDLLVENERIIGASYDAAIWAHKERKLKRVTVLSSSMVFESTNEFPTPEGAERRSPPPLSTYGFQKLACEYYAQGAHEQYGLPYTILRPFNCVGIGEQRALSDKDIKSGNISLAMSHVVPDLVQKIAKGQEPLHILGSGDQIRHYTYGGDLAHGIRLAMESDAAINQDFNLSTAAGHTVRELAEEIWKRLRPDRPFSLVNDPAYRYDVQRRVPAVDKAKQLLGFEANTSLAKILDEVVPWVLEQVKLGNL